METTPMIVRREDAAALERGIEYSTGIHIPVTDRMVERGIWTLED